ncbi:MAG: acyltransferase [Bacteroidota bacterium]
MNYYLHPSSIVGATSQIGAGTRIWHFCHVMDYCVIGERCVLGQNVFVASGVQLGNGVKVQNNVSIYKGVVCEDDVFLGPSMVFTNVINPRSFVERKTEFKPTLVGKGATIGANATVLCGITIGAYAMIGAGAVVTKEVLAHQLVVGNPARAIGWVSRLGHRLSFDADGVGACAESGEVYVLEDGMVLARD